MDRRGKEIVVPFKSRQEVEAYNVKFSEFANTFSIYYMQFTGLLSDEIWPGYERKLVKSLYVQGAQMYTSGFTQRPSFPYQAWVYETLKPYLKESGQAMQTLPDMNWTLSDADFKQLQSELSGEWKTKTMATRKRMKEMRHWKDKPMARIRFGPS